MGADDRPRERRRPAPDGHRFLRKQWDDPRHASWRGNGDEVEERYPLSPMQQGMLFHTIMGMQPGVYVQQIVCTLREETDAAALREAWRRVTERHPVLRTSFDLSDPAEPYQEVHARVALLFAEENLRSLSVSGRLQKLQELCMTDRMRGFDPSRAPLARYTLAHAGDREHYFVWTFHHALLDGRSIRTILREAFDFYEAIRAGGDLRVEIPTPYRRYIDWLAARDFGRAEEFWRGTLRSFTAQTPLPGGMSGRAVLNAAENRVGSAQNVLGTAADGELQLHGSSADEGHGWCERRLSPELANALSALASSCGVTLNTMVQGAWALLLSRHSGEREVVFGAVRACRHLPFPDPASMVGVFINTLPMRVEAAPLSPLIPWLRELRRQWVEMREHEHTPLAEVQRLSGAPRGEPLFNSIVAFESSGIEEALRAERPAWLGRSIRHIGDTNYALTVAVRGAPQLIMGIEYDRARYDPSAAERMLGQLETLLAGMADDPARSLSALPILTADERRTILFDWNETAEAYPADCCVHEIFAKVAADRPHAAAIVCENRTVTYGELDRRANRLAGRLAERGAGPDDAVGICLTRADDVILAALGILKAGAAYVPLDIDNPEARLRFIVRDARLRIVVTEPKLSILFEDAAGQGGEPRPHIISLDVDREWNVAAAAPESPIVCNSEIPAYIIYTSGSTGVPKGVCCNHAGVVNLLDAFDRLAPLRAGDRCSFWTNPGFDASVYEIFSPLISGATLEVVPEEIRLDAQRFFRWLAERQIAAAYVPVIMLEDLVSWLEGGGALPALRRLFVGVEPIDERLLRSIMKRTPGLAVINAYGPTEATVCATLYPVPADSQREGRTPIGKPVQNTAVYLLDGHLEPVPAGVPGELYIAGRGLSRGYCGRPDLTAERFVPNPFGRASANRLYRTGDIARYLPDGNIMFIGRADHQVKIRGFRVELGEIEAALAAHPLVREAAATVREDTPGDQRLVAYIVSRGAGRASADELRAWLRETLPSYMIPSAVVALDEMPRTPSGKPDRRSLPRPKAEIGSSSFAPRSEMERAIAAQWRAVLDLDAVGVHDNFFDLGGNSLLLIKLRRNLQTELHVDVPMVELFRRPTVGELARHVQSGDMERASSEQIRSRTARKRAALDRRSRVMRKRKTDD
jgi:amino acid adenylation domain-containing protein